jgi:hypothetical protein
MPNACFQAAERYVRRALIAKAHRRAEEMDYERTTLDF